VQSDEGFKALWDVYPRHQREQAAIFAFLSLDLDQKPELLAEIIEHVKARKLTEEWRNPLYVPMLDNFLFGARWKDELIKAPAKGTDVGQPDYWDEKVRAAEARGWRTQ
jgi:hypothetical protein